MILSLLFDWSVSRVKKSQFSQTNNPFTGTDLRVLMAKNRAQIDKYFLQATDEISRHHGGFLTSNSGNKGIRRGLLLAKEQLRLLTPDKAGLVCINHNIQETLNFIKWVKMRYLSQLTLRQLLSNRQCLFNVHWILKKQYQLLSKKNSKSKKPQWTEFSRLVKTRIDFIDGLHQKLELSLDSKSSLALKPILDKALDEHRVDYIYTTTCPTKHSVSALLKQAIDLIQEQQQKLNQLPENQAEYELIGLNAVAHYLQQQMH